LKPIQKIKAKGLVSLGEQYIEKFDADVKIISNFTGETVENIILSTDEVKIYKIVPTKDEWTVKYPYRVVFKKNDKWGRCHTVCTSFDEAILTYLGEKYDGQNSQFASFAMKMLQMGEGKTEE
jgi:hypothetical protein